jgi:hypothetical protein
MDRGQREEFAPRRSAGYRPFDPKMLAIVIRHYYVFAGAPRAAVKASPGTRQKPIHYPR